VSRNDHWGVQNVSYGGRNVTSGGSKMCPNGVQNVSFWGGVPDGVQMCQNVQNVGPGGPDSGGDPLWGKSVAGMVHLGGVRMAKMCQNVVKKSKK
jgi:hypothetical protein